MLNLHIYTDVYQYAKALSLFQLANDLQVIEMSYFTPNFYPEKKSQWYLTLSILTK